MLNGARPAIIALVLGSLGTGCSGTIEGDPGSPGAGNGSMPGGSTGVAGAVPGSGGAVTGTGGAGSTAAGAAGTGTGGAVVTQPPPGVFAPAPSRLRRLTSFEYKNSVVDLLGAGTQVTVELDDDATLNNLTSLAAAQLSLSQPVTEQFEKSAMSLAESLAKDTARRAKVVGCTPAGAADEACMRSFITNFGRRVFRRPLVAEEVELYFGVGKNAMTTLSDFWGGVQYSLAALLQSPSFIYREEFGTADAASPAKRALTPYQLASRLSFLLWSTTPDDALLEAAASGALNSTDGLKQQADRLLAAPRSQDAILRIFSEMLSLGQLDSLAQSPDFFPAAASPTLAASMRQETQAVLRDLIFTRNSDYREFFTTNQTYVNAELAKLYGVAAPSGTGFVATTLPANGPRSGYLGHGAFLALNGKSTGTSPTHRGKFIVETLLCRSVPSAPPDVNTELPETNKDKTMRDQLVNHMKDPSCAGCHSVMDPMGLALEHFDGIGAYRETDRNMPLNVAVEFDGVTLNGAKELGAALASTIKTPDNNLAVASCLVRNFYRAATGHLEGAGDEPVVLALSNAFATDGFRVRNALSTLVQSEGFRFVGQPE